MTINFPFAWIYFSNIEILKKVLKKRFKVNFGYGEVISKQLTIDVPGYNGGKNKLNLFDIETIDENIVYDGINFPQWDVNKNLTLFL